jgi:hypothetical protein
MVLLHQAISVHHRIFNRSALQHRHVTVVRILDAETSARQSRHPPRLPSCEASAAPIELPSCGGNNVTVAVYRTGRISEMHNREHSEKPPWSAARSACVLRHNQQIEQRDFSFFR